MGGCGWGGKWQIGTSQPHETHLSEGSSSKPKPSQQDLHKIKTAGSCNLHAYQCHIHFMQGSSEDFALTSAQSSTHDCHITSKVPVLRRRPAQTPPQRGLKAHQACAGAGPVSEHNPAMLLKHSWQQPIQTLPQKDLHPFRMPSASPSGALVH